VLELDKALDHLEANYPLVTEALLTFVLDPKGDRGRKLNTRDRARKSGMLALGFLMKSGQHQ
jgi:hypothetical protein